MNVDKAFMKVLKHHNKGEDVSVVGYYEDIKVLFERIVALKDVCIRNINLHDTEWEGYINPFTLTYDVDGQVWCEKSVYDNGNVGACGGYVLVDEFIDEPERWGIEGCSTIKIV